MALVSPSSRPAVAALAPEEWPNVEAVVTEDDMPVDNIFSEKQQRLLVESLYSSWAGPGAGGPFVALANVGLFYAVHQPPFVPDMLLSLDVHIPPDVWVKSQRSYFIWEYGKPPDVVIEVVSNQKGAEDDRKLRVYARMGVPYYVIFDLIDQLEGNVLRVYRLHEGAYHLSADRWFPMVGLGVTLWHGAYEELTQTWLRWCDQDGNVISTGAELVVRVRQHLAEAEQHAAAVVQRAEQEHQRAERLAAQLRSLGIDPQDA